MKIYFCEKCGVSIPLQEVVGGKATARDGKTYCQGCMPGAAPAEGDLKLYFCDNCKVSIPVQDVLQNRAKTVGERMLCAECARMDESQRRARRNRLREEAAGKEESRPRLHFCDSCNTSIPQSHLITGRAVVKGGRTYCERCKTRVERTRVSASSVVLVVLLLAGVFGMGYFLLGSGRRLFAAARKETKEPDRNEALRADVERRLAEISRRIGPLEAGYEKIREKLPVLEKARERWEESRRETAELSGRMGEAQEALRAEAEERFRKNEAEIRALHAKLAAMEERLRALAAPPAPPAPAPEKEPEAAPPEPETPAKPAPPRVEEVPAEVREALEKLKSPDRGDRFAAAVALARARHKAAVPALVRVLRKDDDVFVRRAAARALGQIDSWSSVPALIDILEDRDPFVAQAAHEALEKITGRDFGLRDGLKRSEIRKLVKQARAWWEEHRNDRSD